MALYLRTRAGSHRNAHISVTSNARYLRVAANNCQGVMMVTASHSLTRANACPPARFIHSTYEATACIQGDL